MNVSRITATALLAVAALSLGSAAATADPAPPPRPAPQSVGYQMHLEGRTLVATLDGGTFTASADGQSVAIDDPSGHTAVQLPLSFRLDDVSYPLRHQISDGGRTLQLTPPENVRAVRPLAVRLVASPVENSRAESYFSQQLQLAVSAGGFVGTAIGAVVGWVSCGFVVIPLCIATIPTFAAFGTLVGSIVAGGPTFVAAGLDLLQTMQAPPGTTHWVDPTR